MARLIDRVAKIEEKIEGYIMPTLQAGIEQREAIKQDVEKVLAIVSGAEKVGGFVKRNLPRAITFGAGIMTAAGVGNPEVLKFISTFFG